MLVMNVMGTWQKALCYGRFELVAPKVCGQGLVRELTDGGGCHTVFLVLATMVKNIRYMPYAFLAEPVHDLKGEIISLATVSGSEAPDFAQSVFTN